MEGVIEGCLASWKSRHFDNRDSSIATDAGWFWAYSDARSMRSANFTEAVPWSFDPAEKSGEIW